MKLSTGRVAFPIEFDNGDVECIYFNPNDPDLGRRLIESKDKIQKRLEEIDVDNLELTNNGESVKANELKNITSLTEDEITELVQNAEKIAKVVNDTKTVVCEELDRAFNGDISSIVFKHCSPFAIVDGDYFVMNFLEAIAPEIAKHQNASNKAVENKMSKYIGKYMK